MTAYSPSITEARIRPTDWRPLPVSTGAGHSFALGDIHGHLDVMHAALDHIAGLPKHAPDTELVLLGDLNDRGPNSMGCMKLGLNGAAERAGVQQHVYLPGNHEAMLASALQDLATLRFWLSHGGEEVLDELGDPETPAELRKRLWDHLGDGLNRLMNGPTHHRIGELLFVHAGIHPDLPLDTFLAQPPVGVPMQDHWGWILEPFHSHLEPWTADDDLLVVHGHCPVGFDPASSGYMRHKANRPESWRWIDPAACDMTDIRRINLDTGCGKDSRAVGVAEFHDNRYRLHVVHLD
jgi:serine/threonine protein phosphatase 1